MLRLRVCLDQPKQFVHTSGNVREQTRRVRVAHFAGGVNGCARDDAPNFDSALDSTRV